MNLSVSKSGFSFTSSSDFDGSSAIADEVAIIDTSSAIESFRAVITFIELLSAITFPSRSFALTIYLYSVSGVSSVSV